MAENRRYYVDGNTARKTYNSAAPVRKKEDQVQAQPERRLKVQPTPKKIENRNKVVILNTVKSVILPFLACAVVVAMFVVYLSAKMEVRQKKDTITSMKKQLATMQSDNKAYSDRLDASVNMDEIYKVATSVLGMVYSEEGRSIYYSQNSKDYVVQYQNVPGAE